MKTNPYLLSVLCAVSVGFGCSDEVGNVGAGGSVAGGGSASEVTWYREVLPVAQQHCMGCHGDDSLSFSMTTFSEDLAARAELMAHVTGQGIMPPWQPSSACNSYDGERLLSDEEKAVFAAWSAGGASEGDPSDAPPELAAPKGLEWVDATLTMAESYTPADSLDGNDHRCFVLDPKLSEDVFFVGYDVKPGEKKVVHHVLLYAADAAALDQLDAAHPGPGYDCPGGPGAGSAQVIAGWVPGTPAYTFPVSTGIRLEAGKKIAMQIHYNIGTAGPLPDQTAVELQYAKEPVANEASLYSMSDHSFAIPPATTGHSAEARMTVPGKATVWAAAPHMHLMGRHTSVNIERQTGGSDCLIEIPEWDFGWQQFYFLDDPQGMKLEKDDEVVLSCTWDNMSDKTVTWGDGTEDEMCIAYFYVTAGHTK